MLTWKVIHDTQETSYLSFMCAPLADLVIVLLDRPSIDLLKLFEEKLGKALVTTVQQRAHVHSTADVSQLSEGKNIHITKESDPQKHGGNWLN